MIYSKVIGRIAGHLGIGGRLMSQSYLSFFHIVLWKWFFLNTKVFYMASCFVFFFFFFSHADTDNKKTMMKFRFLFHLKFWCTFPSRLPYQRLHPSM